MRLVYFFALTPLFFACRDAKNSIDDLVHENLDAARRITSNYTDVMLRNLQIKLYEPATFAKAEVWFPRAEKVTTLSSSMVSYLTHNRAWILKDDGEMEKLLMEMEKYRDSLFSIDIKIKEVFQDDIFLVDESYDSLYFARQLQLSRLSEKDREKLLQVIHFNILRSENRVVAFCHEQVSNASDWFYTDAILFMQDKYVFRPGEVMTIRGGVGAFKGLWDGQVAVGGQILQQNDSGIVVYKHKVPNEPGKYSLTVDAKYLNDFREPVHLTKRIEFKVE